MADWSSASQILRSDDLSGVPCEKVFFLAARGSGESGPGGDTLDPDDPYHGIGGRVMTAYKEFKADLPADNTVTVTDAVSVVYPADSVWIIPKGHVVQYLSDVWAGVIETRRALKERANQCPTEHFVLAGYSQGAMVMHRVLSNTSGPGLDTLNTAILGRIDAAILIADGDRVAGDTTQDYGNAKPNAQGIGTQMDPSVSPTKFPSNIGAKTFSVCNDGDAVCDFRVPYLCAPCALFHEIDGPSVHTKYTDTPEVRNAARAASILVATGHAPPKPPVITTRDLPAGLVGRAYSTDLTTADHRQGTWTITGGTLPAGLNLSGFSITGTPTTVGISIFVLTFTDTNGFVVSASASIGVQDGAAQPLTWTPAMPADPYSGPAQAVSCADTSLCIAADQFGYLQSFNGTSWTRASTIKPLTVDASGPWLTSVSCAPRTTPTSAGFCMAVGANQWATFDGTTWSSVKTVAPGGLALDTPPLSCTSPTFCMLTLSTNAYAFNGTSWTQKADVNATGVAPKTLSCTSSIFCMASATGVDWVYNGSAWATVGTTSESQLTCTATNVCFGISNTGTIDEWNGSTWQISTTGSPTALSCATSQFCIAVDTYGNGKHFDGSIWTADNSVAAWFVIWARSGHVLSCTQDQSCYLLDAAGGGYQYSNSFWHGRTWVGPYTGNASSISCVQTHCTAADRYGNVWTTDDASLTSAPQIIDYNAQGSLWGRTSVSCVSVTFCAMTDMLGGAATFNGSYWSAGYQGDTGDSRTDGPVISCVSATFCAGVDDAGHAFFYQGSHTWSTPVTIDSHSSSTNGLAAISCASANFCVAGSRYPTAYVWNGTSWSATPTPPASINSISCPKVNFCVAVGYQVAMYFDGTTWSAANTIASGQDVVSVSCATALSCAALARPSSGAGGSVLAFNGASWTAPSQLATVGDPVQISCGEPSLCAVVDYEGREYFGYTF